MDRVTISATPVLTVLPHRARRRLMERWKALKICCRSGNADHLPCRRTRRRAVDARSSGFERCVVVLSSAQHRVLTCCCADLGELQGKARPSGNDAANVSKEQSDDCADDCCGEKAWPSMLGQNEICMLSVQITLSATSKCLMPLY